MLSTISDPRKLLLLDGIGAILRSLANFFLLGGKLIQTGMTTELLYSMGAIAACFAVFDFTVLSLRFSTVASLCITAGANLSYVILVIVSVLMHWTSVTSLGITYFSGEVVILLLLSSWELSVAIRSVRTAKVF